MKRKYNYEVTKKLPFLKEGKYIESWFNVWGVEKISGGGYVYNAVDLLKEGFIELIEVTEEDKS